jgi:nitrogen fixation protein FixH
VQDRDDQTVTLLAEGGARYAAEVALRPGVWNVDLSVTGPKGEVWTRAIRFMVKG